MRQVGTGVHRKGQVMGMGENSGYCRAGGRELEHGRETSERM